MQQQERVIDAPIHYDHFARFIGQRVGQRIYGVSPRHGRPVANETREILVG
jgi:hypothetical protein